MHTEPFQESLFKNLERALKCFFYFFTACIGNMYLLQFGDKYATIADLYIFVGILLTVLPFIHSLIMTATNTLKYR